MPLTEQEKERVRYHMGYMGTSYGGGQAAAGIQFGVARPVQTAFLLEEAIQLLLVNPHALSRVRSLLGTLDKIECQLEAASCTLVAARLGELELHPGKDRGMFFTDLLEREYKRWAERLADVLGVPFYPYSTRFRRRGPGSNIPVGM